MPWTSKHHETHLSPVEVLIAIALRFSREARIHSVPEMCDAEPRIRNYSGNCRKQAITLIMRGKSLDNGRCKWSWQTAYPSTLPQERFWGSACDHTGAALLTPCCCGHSRMPPHPRPRLEPP
jgi:hypothetical protein